MQPAAAGMAEEFAIETEAEELADSASKKTWTDAEDRLLSDIVSRDGAHKWSTVAASLPGRAGKQCRERWFNHLCPAVRKGSWTAEEDRIIMESVREHGTKWSFIVKNLPGRTDNAIKNRYNSAMRRQQRLQLIEEAAANGVTLPTRPRGRPEGSGKKAKRKREEEEEQARAAAADLEAAAHASVGAVGSMETGASSDIAPAPAEMPPPPPPPAMEANQTSKAGKRPKAEREAKAGRELKAARGVARRPPRFVPPDGLNALLLSAGVAPMDASPMAEAQRMSQLAAMLSAGDDRAREEMIEILMSSSPAAALSPSLNMSRQTGKLSPPIAEMIDMAAAAHKSGSPFDFNAAILSLDTGYNLSAVPHLDVLEASPAGFSPAAANPHLYGHAPVSAAECSSTQPATRMLGTQRASPLAPGSWALTPAGGVGSAPPGHSAARNAAAAVPMSCAKESDDDRRSSSASSLLALVSPSLLDASPDAAAAAVANAMFMSSGRESGGGEDRRSSGGSLLALVNSALFDSSPNSTNASALTEGRRASLDEFSSPTLGTHFSPLATVAISDLLSEL